MVTLKEQLIKDLWWEINTFWQSATEEALEELLYIAYQHGYTEAEYDYGGEDER